MKVICNEQTCLIHLDSFILADQWKGYFIELKCCYKTDCPYIDIHKTNVREGGYMYFMAKRWKIQWQPT